MKSHVVAVNITGMELDGRPVRYPSQGNGEIAMMKVIQQSGWHGPVGVIVQRDGDAEKTLQNDFLGLDWVAVELKQRGAAGPRPFADMH